MSQISNEVVDAYLLSESSLFVFHHRIVMITCGSTSLIDAVAKVLSYIPLDQVRMLAYERKNELAPQYQPTHFHEDVETLRALLDRKGMGEEYVLGKEDHNHIFLYHYESAPMPGDDITLELLMHGLGDRARALFSDPAAMRSRLDVDTEITRIFPDFQVDGYIFDPMGYSMNAIRGHEYYTFHVTPQISCSYASFETNRRFGPELNETIAKVLSIFDPSSFAVLLYQTTNKAFKVTTPYVLQHQEEVNAGGFCLSFGNYVKPGV